MIWYSFLEWNNKVWNFGYFVHLVFELLTLNSIILQNFKKNEDFKKVGLRRENPKTKKMKFLELLLLVWLAMTCKTEYKTSGMQGENAWLCWKRLLICQFFFCFDLIEKLLKYFWRLSPHGHLLLLTTLKNERFRASFTGSNWIYYFLRKNI